MTTYASSQGILHGQYGTGQTACYAGHILAAVMAHPADSYWVLTKLHALASNTRAPIWASKLVTHPLDVSVSKAEL